MNWKEDKNLTEAQRTLKWSIYCETDMEPDEDIKAVLLSILKDLGAEIFPMERIIEIMDYDFAFRLSSSDIPAYLDEDFEAGEGGESHDAFRVVDHIAMYLRELEEQKQKEVDG